MVPGDRVREWGCTLIGTVMDGNGFNALVHWPGIGPFPLEGLTYQVPVRLLIPMNEG